MKTRLLSKIAKAIFISFALIILLFPNNSCQIGQIEPDIKLTDTSLVVCDPVITIQPVIDITASEAVLRGDIIPNDKNVKVWFELSRADNLNWSKYPLDSNTVYSGKKRVFITLKIKELEAGIKYLAVFKASNSTLQIISADTEFTTAKNKAIKN